MQDENFYRVNHMMSERVAAERLEIALGQTRNWVHFLRNDRRREKPRIPWIKYLGYNVIYRGEDLYAFIDAVRKESIDALGGSPNEHS